MPFVLYAVQSKPNEWYHFEDWASERYNVGDIVNIELWRIEIPDQYTYTTLVNERYMKGTSTLDYVVERDVRAEVTPGGHVSWPITYRNNKGVCINNNWPLPL
jgi:hypothetical protein